jgi:hypothetical protein
MIPQAWEMGRISEKDQGEWNDFKLTEQCSLLLRGCGISQQR